MVKSRRLKVHLYILVDFLCILLSFAIPYMIRYREDIFQEPARYHFPTLQGYLAIYVFWAILTIVFLSLYDLYKTTRNLSYSSEIVKVLKAAFYSFLPAAASVFFFQQKTVSRLVIVLNWVLLTLLLIIWRVLKRTWVRKLVADGYNNINILIIGAGKLGELVAREISRFPQLGMRIQGFLDDHRKGNVMNQFPILGSIDNLEVVLRKNYIEEIFLTPGYDERKVYELLEKSKQFGISLKVVPRFTDMVSQVEVQHIGLLPILQFVRREIHGTEILSKRIFDVVVSLAALICLLPIFIVIAFWIKLDSRGSVFYVSKRCGRKGKVFNFYKFRTMVKDADKKLKELMVMNEKDGPIFKIKNDPRITRIGRRLRRYSLDELPQLWNVLKGDMSLVGPRPPVPEEVKKYEDWQLKRLCIRPGITCLAQVRGRSDLSFRQWMKWDLYYIENWSFWLDLRILWETLWVVMKKKGAY